MSDKKIWNSVSQAIEFIKSKIMKSRAPHYNEIEEALLYCAENEDSIAQYQMYALEYNRDRSNPEIYLKWCKKAALQGHAMAQYDMGLHYWYGEGIEQNNYLAVEWMEKAAQQNYLEAQRKLISVYSLGRKIKPIPERAEYWKKRAEELDEDEIGTIIDLKPWMIVPPEIRERKTTTTKSDQQDNASVQFKCVEQDYVIKADPKKSFIVNAGPGTGKTYTLINRINELVKQGLDESEILVLSFTNAVVDEVGDRLVKTANSLEGDRLLRQVKSSSVKTFHSFAYWLLKEANKDTELERWEQIDLSFNKMSYNDCLLKGAQLLQEYKDIAEGWRYVIIDEIQDINMEKALFVLSLLDACIEYECAFLLLGDSCQSIYEYVAKKNTGGYSKSSSEFYADILVKTKSIAEFVSFDKNFRSKSDLQKYTVPIRNHILNEDSMGFHMAVDDLREKSHIIESNEMKALVSDYKGQNICIMERSNFATKMRSIELIKEGVIHTCALSNHNKKLAKWIGRVFSEYEESTINYDQFKECMQKAVNEADEHMLYKWWANLKDQCDTYSNVLKMSDVTRSIANKNFRLEEGETKRKITVSNIHRSKGLEYDCVVLSDTFARNAYKKLEEMKTLYVAITRPKTELVFFKQKEKYHIYHSFKDSREYVYGDWKNGETLKYVEILNKEDYADYNPIDFFISDESIMKEAQRRILSLCENSEVYLWLDKNKGQYAIVQEKGRLDTIMGWMPAKFSKSIEAISRKSNLPVGFDEIYIDGVYSYIVTSDFETLKLNKQLQESTNVYAKSKIWNYIHFSGPCHAMYED